MEKYSWTFYVQATCFRYQTYSQLISMEKLPKKLQMQYSKENSANLTHIFCRGVLLTGKAQFTLVFSKQEQQLKETFTKV